MEKKKKKKKENQNSTAFSTDSIPKGSEAPNPDETKERLKNLLDMESPPEEKKKKPRKTKADLEFENEIALMTGLACGTIVTILDAGESKFLKIRVSTPEEIVPRAEQFARLLNFYLEALMKSKYAPLLLFAVAEGGSVANRFLEKATLKKEEKKEEQLKETLESIPEEVLTKQ